jgi:bifunctional ADP-heptose synthase (sugar kinase/adenylyltransferase)
VCLNSDASVRALKGPRRPVVGQADRAAVLRGAGLRGRRPDLRRADARRGARAAAPAHLAKGADYAHRELPEASVLAGWGGEIVLLPFLMGKSSTRFSRRPRFMARR